MVLVSGCFEGLFGILARSLVYKDAVNNDEDASFQAIPGESVEARIWPKSMVWR